MNFIRFKVVCLPLSSTLLLITAMAPPVKAELVFERSQAANTSARSVTFHSIYGEMHSDNVRPNGVHYSHSIAPNPILTHESFNASAFVEVEVYNKGDSIWISGNGFAAAYGALTYGSSCSFAASIEADVRSQQDDLTTFYLAYSINQLDPISSTTLTTNAGTFTGPSSGLQVFDANQLHIAARLDHQAELVAPPNSPYIFSDFQSEMAVVWGAGSLPGSTPDNPLIPVDDLRDSSVESAQRSYLTMPIVGAFGIEGFVFLDPAVAEGYHYEVDGANFASFIVPDSFPNGDDLFSLEFEGLTVALHAGETFNFTDYFSAGVSKFSLLGIDLDERIDPTPAPPFVSGFKFTNEGVVTLTQSPNAVPETTSLFLIVLGMLVVVRKTASPTA